MISTNPEQEHIVLGITDYEDKYQVIEDGKQVEETLTLRTALTVLCERCQVRLDVEGVNF